MQDDYARLLDNAIASASQAISLDHQGMYSAALSVYDMCIKEMREGLRLLPDGHSQSQVLTDKLASYERRCAEIRSALSGRSEAAPTVTAAPPPLQAPKLEEKRRSAPRAQRVEPAANRGPLSRVEEMNEVKRALNTAIDADRDGDDERDVLKLYETGLEGLMRMYGTEKDKEQKAWLKGELEKHLARAEHLKDVVRERELAERWPTLTRALSEFTDAEECHDTGEYREALPHYEEAKELLRTCLADPRVAEHGGGRTRVTLRERLAHCAVRSEELRKWGEDGGFKRPVAFGKKNANDKYVDLMPPPSKWSRFKHKASKTKKKIKRDYFEADPWR